MCPPIFYLNFSIHCTECSILTVTPKTLSVWSGKVYRILPWVVVFPKGMHFSFLSKCLLHFIASEVILEDIFCLFWVHTAPGSLVRVSYYLSFCIVKIVPFPTFGSISHSFGTRFPDMRCSKSLLTSYPKLLRAFRSHHLRITKKEKWNYLSNDIFTGK